MVKQLLPRPTYPVKPGTNFPEIRPFYWPAIPAGQWLIMRLRCSQVVYIVCVVENRLHLDDAPALVLHLGKPGHPTTIQRKDIRNLRRYSGPTRTSH